MKLDFENLKTVKKSPRRKLNMKDLNPRIFHINSEPDD
jgi:hypothetical protein